MSNAEIKAAMRDRLPVVCDGIEYAYIREYILTFDDNGNQHLSVGLMDKNMRSIVRVNLEKVRLAERKEEEK